MNLGRGAPHLRAAAGGTRGAGFLEEAPPSELELELEEGEEEEEEEEEATAATPPPARSPKAAFQAPPPAFAMAPALEAMAAAETAKALRIRFVEEEGGGWGGEGANRGG